jgi:Smg protein
MKDNLFELLLNLFEKSLTQLQKGHHNNDTESTESNEDEQLAHADNQSLYLKPAQQQSTRIFTYDEQMKLTKASYQFLMRMKLWGVLNSDLFELVMNQLQLSESRIITLQETKWTIRNCLTGHLTEEQLSFLDLVLYQTEDELTIH